jgi:hypothetical protein
MEHVIDHIMSLAAPDNAQTGLLNSSIDASAPSSPIPSITFPHGGIVGIFFTVVSLAITSDWVKLVLLGGFFEAVRRIASALYMKLWDSIFMNVYFQQDDQSYREFHSISSDDQLFMDMDQYFL